MKRNINFLLVATGIVAITACGNSTNSNSGESDSIQQDSVTLSSTNAEKNNKLVIKPKTLAIEGELGSCFDVVDNAYEFTENDGYSAILTVDVTRNKQNILFNPVLATTFDGEEGGIGVAFGIVVLDESGKVIHEDVAGEIGHGAPAYPEDAIEVVNLQEGKTGKLRFAISNMDKVNNKCTFKITSAWQEIQ